LKASLICDFRLAFLLFVVFEFLVLSLLLSEVVVMKQFSMRAALVSRALSVLFAVAFLFAAARAQTPDVDTSQYDARIREALAKVKRPNATDADKRALAAAYLERANFYYNAGVPMLYKLALGDFRRVLRYDPNNQEAKEKLDMLVSIYNSIGRPVPANGSDPNDDGLTENGTTNNVINNRTTNTESARRIRFAPGSNQRTVRGAVARSSVERYTINAQAGQKLTLRLKEKGATFRLINARTKETLKDAANVMEWSSELPETGDYIIEISTSQAKTNYTLEVTLGENVEVRSY
jgi:tetratricopeptide (TPR) repeat protein